MIGPVRAVGRLSPDRRIRALCVDDEAVTLKLIGRLVDGLGTLGARVAAANAR